jgi:beta-lactamase class A
MRSVGRHYYRRFGIASSVSFSLAAAALAALVLPAVPAARAGLARPGHARSVARRNTVTVTAPRVRCVALRHDKDALASKMARDIDRQLSGRASSVGLDSTDGRTGITCQYHATSHFIAASAIKVTILAALMRKLQQEHRQLSAAQKRLARLMITRSDNSAATALWDQAGHRAMQHFLDLARMRQTVLSQAWGLTLLTAHDEALLLKLLTAANTVLTQPNRIYARYLMARVIPAQRWGVSAGAPLSTRVHIKNGWLPFPPDGPWEINSIGAFTSPHRVYLMAILTYDNPSMAYGIDTIEDVAEAINHDLNPGAHHVVPPSVPSPSWEIPDESLVGWRA